MKEKQMKLPMGNSHACGVLTYSPQSDFYSNFFCVFVEVLYYNTTFKKGDSNINATFFMTEAQQTIPKFALVSQKLQIFLLYS